MGIIFYYEATNNAGVAFTIFVDEVIGAFFTRY